MFDLLGKTYNNLQTFVPIQTYQINYYKNKYFKYIHPEFIKCVIDQDEILVGFLISMPSFSKALKKATWSQSTRYWISKLFNNEDLITQSTPESCSSAIFTAVKNNSL